ncbi:MAG TPA: chaperone modulator CbpM [Desulfomonilaceae bacterium]|nr:chaperone modulator CbpM [Desulfomonilaceae bacterium]
MTQDFFYRRQIIEIFEIDEDFLSELEHEELIHSIRVEAVPEHVFPVEELERIRIIQNLVKELEVNLAGVEVILEMRDNMIRMQQQFNFILEKLVGELKTHMKG